MNILTEKRRGLCVRNLEVLNSKVPGNVAIGQDTKWHSDKWYCMNPTQVYSNAFL
jgi:hypothetical protein